LENGGRPELVVAWLTGTQGVLFISKISEIHGGEASSYGDNKVAWRYVAHCGVRCVNLIAEAVQVKARICIIDVKGEFLRAIS
jgi:hypothetical protein